MKQRLDITARMAGGLWEHLSDRYFSERVPRRDGPLLRAAHRMLTAMGVGNHRAFLAANGLSMVENIHVPFVPGEASMQWPPIKQVCMAVHEHHHVYQAEEYGGMAFAVGYLTDVPMRTHLEAEALRTTIELMWWLTGRMVDPEPLARSVMPYGCGPNGVRYVRAYLAQALPDIEARREVSETVTTATGWLDSNKGWAGPA